MIDFHVDNGDVRFGLEKMCFFHLSFLLQKIVNKDFSIIAGRDDFPSILEELEFSYR